jgi:response regulator RpfG family c-di-GMP phosphodiesterase
MLSQKHTLLFVDDEVSITRALKRLFRRTGHTILTADSGPEALLLLKKSKKPIALIMSDQRMPRMTGAQFLAKAKDHCPDAIRFLLTGYSEMDALVDAINQGEIHRYLAKPWNDDQLLAEVEQALRQYEMVRENERLHKLTLQQKEELETLNQELEKRVQLRTRSIMNKNKELKQTAIKMEKSLSATIRLITTMVETVSPELRRYLQQVAETSVMIAKEMDLGSMAVEAVERAALLHDIGCLSLEKNIWMNDERSLAEDELEEYRQHPLLSSVFLEDNEMLEEVAEMVLFHHERYDGTGYPNGLHGRQIPVGARIIAACGDYHRFFLTWPNTVRGITANARRYLGSKASEVLIMADADTMKRQAVREIMQSDRGGRYDEDIVKLLLKTAGGSLPMAGQGQVIPLKDLAAGMRVRYDLRTRDNRLLLPGGRAVKESVLAMIATFSEQGLLDDTIEIVNE